MKILYFSWIKEKIGKNEEIIELNEDVDTGFKLVIFLKSKGKNYEDAFNTLDNIRFSINMKNSNFRDSVKNDDEVAFFPPMTGG